MKHKFYASLFIGLGLTLAAAPTIAKTAPIPVKKQASAKPVKSNNKKIETTSSKKLAPSKTKTEVVKADKHNKTKVADVKHSKNALDTKDKKHSEKQANTKDKFNKSKAQQLANDKETKHNKVKTHQLADAKNDKHSKSKLQQLAAITDNKHNRKKSHQKESYEENTSVGETNEATEETNTSFDEVTRTEESEQTAIYESNTAFEKNNATPPALPLIARPESVPAKPLFSPSLTKNDTEFLTGNSAKPTPKPVVEPVPLFSAPSKTEHNPNEQRVHTLISKDSAPQIFASDNEAEDKEDLSDTEETSSNSSMPNKRIHTAISRHNNNFITNNNQETNTYEASAHGVVEGSLAEAGARAGLSEDMMVELTEIFAWDINFANNLQAGDQFTVIYDNNGTGNNRIIAAEFINRGKTYRAIRYKNQEGIVSYYAPDGHSLRKAFLTTPVDFARVSSHFSTHRHHPILNRIRAHKGVDYAARTGTPVKAAGDGVVTFHGTQGGYGNMIIIAHGEHYETAYAHLSNFRKNLVDGQPVKQGEVIGYVGQSGLATGPHLHYEFRVDGQHRDPEKLDSSQGMRLAGEDWNSFHAQTVPVLTNLNAAKANNLVAENQPNRRND